MKDQRSIEKLNPEEKRDWDAYVQLYEQNGWVGDDAQRKAWDDLQQKYPRLKQFPAGS